MPLSPPPSIPENLPGMVKSSADSPRGSDAFLGVQHRLDRLSEQVDACLSEILSLRSNNSAAAVLPSMRLVPVNPALSSSPAPRSSVASRASRASQGSMSAESTRSNNLQEESRRVARSSILSQVTVSTSGISARTATTSGRQQLMPYNEFGNAEVLSQRQLSRRIGQFRRRARPEARFLEDPADARVTVAREWLGERRRCDIVWLTLDEPQSSRTAWWIAWCLRFLVATSVVVTCLEAGDEALLDASEAAVLETVIDSIFFFEFLCRVISAPSKKTYLLDFYNWADILAASGIFLRAAIGFVIAPSLSVEEEVIHALLLYVLPTIRLLKMLRYINSFRLLTDAVTNSLESLPVLLYTMVLIVLASASALYVVESRANIPTLAHSVWLALVTMTTVGYGDFAPKSTSGYVITSILTVVSVLFIAMPVGLVGHEFTVCWQNRERVLLLARARKRFAQWGLQGRDVQLLFEYADTDRDGSLNLLEFCELLSEMKLGLDNDSIIELFRLFDDDGNGFIDLLEFVEVLFPDRDDDDVSDVTRNSLRASVVASTSNLPAVQELEESE